MQTRWNSQQLRLRPDDIAVTGLGLNSPIGNDVVTACAAARAGIARPSEFPYMVFDPVSGEMVPVSGHQIEIHTKGFVGLGRLCRLGIPAIHDLINNSHIYASFLKDSPIYLNVSDRFLLNCSDQPVDEDGSFPEAIEEDELGSILEEDCSDRLVPLLESGARLKFGSKLRLQFEGHDGVIRLVQMAVQELRTGMIERCVVGGIDSYVEQSKLQSFHALRLLLGPEDSHGFIPGEAASLLLLERVDAASRRNARIQAIIGPIGVADEPHHRFSKSLTTGTALATALKRALEQLGDPRKRIHLVISDLNGDHWRAHEWGNALIKLKEDHGLRSAEVLLPAESFGELGAAEAAVAICMGVRAFVRNYAKTKTVLLTASSYNGRKAAMALLDPRGFEI